MNKAIIFDMDGTIADTYRVSGWLADLRSEKTRPYEIAKSLYEMDILNSLLNELKAQGWRIIVTTWLSKGSTRAYDNAVRVAKKEWLDKYNFPYDELHMVKYGRTKADMTRKLGGYQVLVDDNEKVRKGWHLGDTINANEDIIGKLMELLLIE